MSDTYGQNPDTPQNADAAPANGAMPLSEQALASVHTSNFPDVLRHFHSSLAVGTY